MLVSYFIMLGCSIGMRGLGVSIPYWLHRLRCTAAVAAAAATTTTTRPTTPERCGPTLPCCARRRKENEQKRWKENEQRRLKDNEQRRQRQLHSSKQMNSRSRSTRASPVGNRSRMTRCSRGDVRPS